MEQTPRTTPVLLHSSDFESHRILGILKKRDLVAPEELHLKLATAATRNTKRLKHVSSANGLSLISEKNQYEGFWNILLTLDTLYWGSALILSDPPVLEKTFDLVEYCEQSLFPHLENQDRTSHRPHSKRTRSYLAAYSPITHLLQWLFSTEAQKAQHSHEAKMQYRGIQEQSLRDIERGLQEVIQEAELLPEVPRDIVQGNIVGAIQYARNVNPHMEHMEILARPETSSSHGTHDSESIIQ